MVLFIKVTTTQFKRRRKPSPPFLPLTFLSYYHFFENLFLCNFSVHMQPAIILNPESAGKRAGYTADTLSFEYLNFWTCFYLFALTATSFQSLPRCHQCASSTWDNTWSQFSWAFPLPALLSLHHRAEHSGCLCWSFWHVFFFFFCMPLCTPSPQNLSLLCKLSHAFEYIIYWSAPSVSSANLTSHQWGKTLPPRDKKERKEGSWKTNTNL